MVAINQKIVINDDSYVTYHDYLRRFLGN